VRRKKEEERREKGEGRREKWRKSDGEILSKGRFDFQLGL
jgi:hypothetical protein